MISRRKGLSAPAETIVPTETITPTKTAATDKTATPNETTTPTSSAPLERTSPETPRPRPPMSPTRTTTPPMSRNSADGDQREPPHIATPPSSPIVPTSNDSTDEPSTLPANTSCSERAPPHLGEFTFNGTSPFITPAAIDYLQTITAGQHWVAMIKSYLRFEELPVVKGVSVVVASGPSSY